MVCFLVFIHLGMWHSHKEAWLSVGKQLVRDGTWYVCNLLENKVSTQLQYLHLWLWNCPHLSDNMYFTREAASHKTYCTPFRSPLYAVQWSIAYFNAHVSLRTFLWIASSFLNNLMFHGHIQDIAGILCNAWVRQHPGYLCQWWIGGITQVTRKWHSWKWHCRSHVRDRKSVV